MNKIMLFFLVIVLSLILLNKYWVRQAQMATNNKPKPISSSNREQCSYQQSQMDKFITTTFQDYKFIYPCSAEPIKNGSHHLNYHNHIRFEIKLFLLIDKNNNTIWPQTPTDKDSVVYNAKLRIFAGGKGIETPQFNVKKDNLEFVKKLDEAQLEIYHNFRRVAGFLSQEKDAIGNPPVIKCTLDKPESLGTIFTKNFKNLDYDANCRAYWMLSEDIAVKLYDFDTSFAYRFAEIYKNVSTALKPVMHIQRQKK